MQDGEFFVLKAKLSDAALTTARGDAVAQNLAILRNRVNELGVADAVVAKTMPRENELLNILRESKGTGWVIGNTEMQYSLTELHKANLITSYEGAAAFAAVEKARVKGLTLGKTAVLLTGKYYTDD